MSIIYLETLNIEWGQIDPKDNRRVKQVQMNFSPQQSTQYPIMTKLHKHTDKHIDRKTEC